MIQRHSIILWKKAETADKGFDEIASEIYETLNVLQEFPVNLRPNFLTGVSKQSVTRLDWNIDNVKQILKSGVNREETTLFENLGYSASFCSSADDSDSCGFLVKAGNKDKHFYNTFIMHLPELFDLYDVRNAAMIKSLFEKLVGVYKPFWGCVSNRELSRKYEAFLDGAVPSTVHWLNYWSDEIISHIKKKKIDLLAKKVSSLSFCDGILSIREMPIDVNNEDDVKYHSILHKKLIK